MRDKTRRDKTRRDKKRRDKTRRDKTRRADHGAIWAWEVRCAW